MTESVWTVCKLKLQVDFFIKNRGDSEQTPHRKVEALTSLYKFHDHEFLRTVLFRGDFGG